MNNVASRTDTTLNKLIDYMVRTNYSPATIDQRVKLLRRLGVSPAVATLDDCLAVIPAGAANSTRRVYAGALRAAFRDLVTMGLRDDNPLEGVRVIAPQGKRPRPIPAEVLELLLAQPECDELQWTRLGALAGLRAAEVSYARVGDVEDMGRGPVLRVEGKGGRLAYVPAHRLVVEAIAAATWRVAPSGLSTRWASWARQVTGHTFNFHQLRHSYGTRLYEATKDPLLVRDLMRHLSVRSTEMYVQPDTESMFAVVSRL